MDELFGGRQNINPSHTMTNSDSEDEDESLPNSLAIEMLESQPVYSLEESQDDDMMMNEVMDREYEEEEQLESPKEISNVPTLDLTEAVLLRNEDGSNELIGVGTVSSQSSSSASLSSLSVNTPGNGLPVKKVTKAPKVIKASSVIVEPSLAEAAAKLCADAEGKTVIVGAANKGPSKESFASK